jgi:hypothetical protein
MKEFIVKESTGFRLRVKSWKCISPSDLNSLEFIQESKDDNGDVTESSTYQFFLTDLEIKSLTEGLLK